MTSGAEIRSWEQRPIQHSICSSIRRAPHWKCFLLTLMIIGCLAAIVWCRLTAIASIHGNDNYGTEASPCDDGYVYIPSAFVIMLYLVYLVECWHCHTRIELRYKTDVESVMERIRMLREALPVIWWKAECYHYVRRTRQITRYRNGDAFTSIQVYYERVNTHTTTSAFNYASSGVKDISKHLKGMEDYPIIKIKFTKGFSFACIDSEREFEDQRFAFFQDNDRRDDFMQSFEGLELGHCDFKDFLVAFADTDHLPWYVTRYAFWLCSLLLLSWPLRTLIECKTAEVDYVVHKVFGLNYIPEFNQSQLPRTITMGSSELEFNISNNNGMIPSYSEAILMECASNPPRWTSDVNGNITPTVTPTKPNGFGFYHPSYGTLSNNGGASGKGGSLRRIVPRNKGIRYVCAKSEPDLFAKEIDDCTTRRDKRNKKKRKIKIFENGTVVPPRRSQSSMSTLGGATAISPDGIPSMQSVLQSTGSTPATERPPPYELALQMNKTNINSHPLSPSTNNTIVRLPSINRRSADQQPLCTSDELSLLQERVTRHVNDVNSPRDTVVVHDGSTSTLIRPVRGSATTRTPRPHSVHVTSFRNSVDSGTQVDSSAFEHLETRL